MNSGNYLIVSPVRDEERHIGETIASVTRQTLRPSLWVFADDGSRDATPEIIREAAQRYPWIRYVRLERDGGRKPGNGVVAAFCRGLEEARDIPADFVAKVDCDLSFPPDYFERLLAEFAADRTLGIASGVYEEQAGSAWQVVEMPEYHAAGACKVVRRACFEQIGGFLPARGWDTVDEIRAQMHGWKTRHLPGLRFRHLKPEGSGIGQFRTGMMHGEIFYLTGGSGALFLLKGLRRMIFGKPPLLAGLWMCWGFLRPFLCGKPRLVTPDEARFYNRLLLGRIAWRKLALLFGSTGS